MLLLLSIVMKQLHLSKFYKVQLFALTRKYLVNLSILMIFLSIEVERFDKKKKKKKKNSKLIQQFGEQTQVLSKSNACMYRKEERFRYHSPS